MRTLIILARKHGGKKMEMAGGPEVPVRQQSDDFKRLFCQSDINDKYEYAELWSSDAGRLKHRKLRSAKQSAARIEAQASAVEESKARAAAKVKAQEEAQAAALAEEKAKRDAVLAAKAARNAQFQRTKPGTNAAKQAAEEAALQAELEAEQKAAKQTENQ